MGIINVLDCTLRDGGYCNNWNFREKNISKIIDGLLLANVEIIECGFLTNKVARDSDSTKYNNLQQLDSLIPEHGKDTEFVVMINIGEYDVEDLPDCADSLIDGLRIAFHKSKVQQAISFCNRAKEKGYKIFMQPMVTMGYQDDEFEGLVTRVNELMPTAFYLVDSFGTMDEDVLKHYYQIADEKLDRKILIGFHSHNNLQLAFSNAKSFIKMRHNRKIIIDSSIYGMGRGAGNLNSELFLNYLNRKYSTRYIIKPILQIMDEVISYFYNERPWGYSLPNYLSAVHLIHPNYAKFLTEKSSLLLDDMDNIFSMMDSEKAVEYNEEYIKELYTKYMSNDSLNNDRLAEVKERFAGKKVLLIAPGRTATTEAEKIKEIIKQESPIVISINHEYTKIDTDYIFISNIRRFKQLNKTAYPRTISTSNIKCNDTFLSVDYYKLLNGIDVVRDNAGLMAIKFLIDFVGVDGIYLAGIDGYTENPKLNYETEDMTIFIDSYSAEQKNRGLKSVIDECRKKVDIAFVTSTLLE